MRIVNMGVELDRQEQLVWAKANTRTHLSLSGDDLQAIITEHTEPADDGDPEWRKIPAADFERADAVLGRLIVSYVALLDSSIAPEKDSLGAIEVEGYIKTAAALGNAICDNIAAR